MNESLVVMASASVLLNAYLAQIIRQSLLPIRIAEETEWKEKDCVIIVTDYERLSPEMLGKYRDLELRVIVFVSENSVLCTEHNSLIFGMLESSSDEREFLICLEQVLQGRLFFSSGVIRRVSRPAPSPLSVLTRREKQILSLFAGNCTMTKIADQLHISPNTVNNHLANIRSKLNLEGPNSLVRFSELYRTSLLGVA